MKAALLKDLPAEKMCNRCTSTKPLEEMVVQHRKSLGYYYVRPICKACHNAKERGHRREYKARYLAQWRKRNASLVKSYWDNDAYRENAARRADKRFRANHAALLIQGRLHRRGMTVTLAEAQELLERFGPCYPTRFGLTEAGLRECERIRGRLRNRNVERRRRQTPTEIRMMVYEEGGRFVIPPDQQPMPYQKASERLKQWHRNRRVLQGEK